MRVAPWLVALALQTVVTEAVWIGTRVMLGYRAIDDGVEPAHLGILLTASALPALVTAIPAGRLSDRLGGSSLLAIGSAAEVAGVAVGIWGSSISAFAAAACLIGFGHILLVVGQQTFIANMSEPGTTDASFGWYMAAGSVGQLLGPIAVGIVAAIDAPATRPNASAGLVVCLILVLIGAPAAIAIRRVDRALPRVGHSAPRPRALDVRAARTLWRPLVVSCLVLVTIDLLTVFVPVWAVARGVDAAAVGILLAVRALVSLIARMGIGRLITAHGRTRVLIAAIGAAVVAFAMFPFADFRWAIPVMVGLGLGLGLPQPLTMAWLITQTPPRAHGAVVGLRMASNRLAQLTIPFAVSAVAAPAGIAGVFLSAAALLGGAIAIVAGSDRSARS